MSVMLSAASCRLGGEKADRDGRCSGIDYRSTAGGCETLVLSGFYFVSPGERTPHNNPEAKGGIFGLTYQHGPAELARAVLEGGAMRWMDE